MLAAYLEAVDAGWAPRSDGVPGAGYPVLRSELEAFFAAQDQVQTLSASIRSDTSMQGPSAGDATEAVDGTAPVPAGGGTALVWRLRTVGGDRSGGMGVVYEERTNRCRRSTESSPSR